MSKQDSSDNVVLSKDEWDEIKGQLVILDTELTRLLAQPLVYATVVKADNKFDLSVFEFGDRMVVIDKDLKKKKKFFGKIASQGVDPEGWVILEYANGDKDRLNIGLNGNIPQVKLVGKDDGMNVVITHEGKLFEVHGLPGTFFKPSENVKVDMESKQIHASCGVSAAGDVAFVKSIVDEEHVEVENNGMSRVVIFGLKDKIKESDRVMLDNSNTMVVRVLEQNNQDRFTLLEETNVEWDQIAGLDDAKDQLIEALELPYQNPEIYKFYNMSPPKGVLLHGPQGCGKTLCAKACASSLARVHGADNFQSGFIYVKGPELLSKWVGHAEQEIRALFARSREHYARHKYPALLFIDEADAILPMRGTGKSSDVENTIVPQFLSEMDGLEDSHVMVLLATNQPRRLDPAVIREGRVDRHVKINRPTLENAKDYFKLHLQGTPILDKGSMAELIEIGVNEIFSEKRAMYRVTSHKTTEIFRMSDSITGAMICGIVQMAKSIAMKRDLQNKKKRGVGPEDIVASVHEHYVKHSDLNPAFDLEDFCDRLGLDRKSANVEKLVIAK